MRIATIRIEGRELAAVRTPAGLVPVPAINAHRGRAWPVSLEGLISQGLSHALLEDALDTPGACAVDAVQFGPLYRHPRKIWGIGLNYVAHARDLGAPVPVSPASFIKGDHTIIGPGDVIELPPQSQRVTAEAELGVLIGRRCRDVALADVPSVVAGYCLILDMTAEDILEQNPRFLTRSKNFDTFFSFGPELVTADELGPIADLEVGTWKNGHLHREDRVAGMAMGPHELVSFHSQVMTLYPGDIISTGTPGAVVIEDGDLAQCRITGMGELANPVRRLSEEAYRRRALVA